MLTGCFVLKQHRIIPALRLKHRSGGSPRQEPPQAAVALRSASLRLGVRHGICVAKMLDNTQSIICAFGLAAAAPRSPYRHLELCGIALILQQLTPQRAACAGEGEVGKLLIVQRVAQDEDVRHKEDGQLDRHAAGVERAFFGTA